MLGNLQQGRRSIFRIGSWLSAALLLAGLVIPWDGRARGQGVAPENAGPRIDAPPDQAIAQANAGRVVEPAEAGPGDAGFSIDGARLAAEADRWLKAAFTRYQRTPPGDRVAWGGLAVCSLLGLSIMFERLVTLRQRRIIPGDFAAKFLDRLHGGKLDAGRALDYCEENPSPAARIALAAVRRWGRPAADLERAVALSHRVESDKLRRNVGTLRRIAVLTPLVGFLGTLLAAARTLAAIPPEVSGADLFNSGLPWGPALASALMPLTAGVVIATLVVVAYDGLAARIEKLAGALDRLGAETIDAIAMTAPTAPTSLTVPTSRAVDLGNGTPSPTLRTHAEPEIPRMGIFGLARPHHPSPQGSDNSIPDDQRLSRYTRKGSARKTSVRN